MIKKLQGFFQFISKYIVYIYLFIFILWEPPLPVDDTAKEALNEIEKFYKTNNHLPDDLSFISDKSLRSDIEQFQLPYQVKDNNMVYLNVGVPTYTYNLTLLDRVTFGLFIKKNGTGTITRYGRQIK